MINPCVTTICYGEKKIWGSRKKAWDFFFEAFQNSEGHEQGRYANILSQLAAYKDVCKDEM